ncbi:MAG: polyprenyl synthetase family protein [Zoogloeaceae bacterium]|nr:polyprenyl synthetase family protein [Zoogloeaceae bacterium]
MNKILPGAEVSPKRLHEAMRYSVLGGGKRIRALLAFAAGDLTDARREPLLVASAAVELIHAYSLIHDDLPCMDDDALRRGRPSCHVAFDEATALLAGDALQSLAFECLAKSAPSPEQQLRSVRILARASGSLGMAGGQAIDLESVGKSLSREALEWMHTMKTGALIRAAVHLGALCGNRLSDAEELEEWAELDRFAGCAGLLFQVVDDILDGTTESATLGKTAGKDDAANKPTYVSLLGLNEAKHYAGELRDEAHEILAELGAGAKRLAELTDFICERRF